MAEMMASLFCLKVVSCERSQGQWLSSVPGDSRLAVKILTSSWAQGTEDWQSLEKTKQLICYPRQGDCSVGKVLAAHE